MISEDKIRLMTRVAVCEDRYAGDISIKKKYRLKDFMSLRSLQAFFFGTFSYLIAMVGFVYYFDVIAEYWGIHKTLIQVVPILVTIYVCYTILNMAIILLHVRTHYRRLSATSQKYIDAVNALNKYYNE